MIFWKQSKVTSSCESVSSIMEWIRSWFRKSVKAHVRGWTLWGKSMGSGVGQCWFKTLLPYWPAMWPWPGYFISWTCFLHKVISSCSYWLGLFGTLTGVLCMKHLVQGLTHKWDSINMGERGYRGGILIKSFPLLRMPIITKYVLCTSLF